MSELPTRDRIAGLPLRAQVAFAARCARCVQPWFECWCDGSPKDREVVEAAIQAAEDFAEAKRRLRSTIDIAVAVRRVAKATIDSARTASDRAIAAVALKAVNAILAAAAARGAAAYAHGGYRSFTSNEAFAAAEAG